MGNFNKCAQLLVVFGLLADMANGESVRLGLKLGSVQIPLVKLCLSWYKVQFLTNLQKINY